MKVHEWLTMAAAEQRKLNQKVLKAKLQKIKS